MKAFIKKILGTSALLIFIGLALPAGVSAEVYEFGGVLPSEQTSFDNGMFANQNGMYENQNNLFAPQMRGFDDGDGDDDFPDDGGDVDCPDCYVDAPIGNGIYVLMLMVMVYGGLLFYRRRKETIDCIK